MCNEMGGESNGFETLKIDVKILSKKILGCSRSLDEILQYFQHFLDLPESTFIILTQKVSGLGLIKLISACLLLFGNNTV